MPVWNGYKFIDRAINSILNQWFHFDPPEIEIVLINDCSTDHKTKGKLISWEIRLKNGKELSHITAILITHLRNMGVACARNSGIAKSHGEYICYLDADDVYYNNRIEDSYRFLNQFSMTDAVIIPYDAKVKNESSGEYDMQLRLQDNGEIGVMHTRRLTDKLIHQFGSVFPDNLVTKEFWVFYQRLILLGQIQRLPKTAGLCTLEPFGQDKTQRLPDSGLGIEWNEFINQEENKWLIKKVLKKNSNESRQNTNSNK